MKAVELPVGTRVEISFGPALPCDDGTLVTGRMWPAAWRAWERPTPARVSPYWYDAAQFHELLYASGNTPVRELIAKLDGCSGGKAGEIVAAAKLGRALCKDVTRDAGREAAGGRARQRQAGDAASGSEPSGRTRSPDYAYACSCGVVEFGAAEPHAEIPFVVEAWAETDERQTRA